MNTSSTSSPTDDDMVWYASYGSNLDRARFLAYLTGATLPDTSVPHRGARDTSEPLADRSLELPHQLFFGGASKRWGGGGVAFLDRAETGRRAKARAYLITTEQFEDVFAQENGQPTSAAIDRAAIERDGALEAGGRWYGLILRCGEIEGRPVLTFTSPTPAADWDTTAPGPSYLRRLAAGLKASHDVDDEQIARYFLSCPGVHPHWSAAGLQADVLDHV